MSTIKPFRTFAAPYGVSTKMFVYPHLENTKCDVITHLDIPTIVRCYWLIEKITIHYSYEINDFPIKNTFILDATSFTLFERITVKDYGLHKNVSDPKLAIDTECHFYPAQVFSDQCHLTWPEAMALEQSLAKTPPLLWHPISPKPTERLSLRLDFKETADNGDFSLTTSDWLNESYNPKLIDSYTTPFLNSSITFRLRTRYPNEIEGKIHTIEVLPEFFSVE